MMAKFATQTAKEMVDEFNEVGQASFSDAIEHALVPALGKKYDVAFIHGESNQDDEHRAYKEYLLTVKKGKYGASAKFKLKSDGDDNGNDVILLQRPDGKYIPCPTKTKKQVAAFVAKLTSRLDATIQSAEKRAKAQAVVALK